MSPHLTLRTTSLLLLSASLLLGLIVWGRGASHAQTPNTTLTYTTYLGTAATSNEAVAVAITPNQEIIVALNSDTSGELRRYAADGATLLSQASLAGAVEDMDVNHANGDIAAVGSFGLKVYNATLATDYTTRTQTLGEGAKRVDISTAGLVVTSHGDTVSLWAANGTLMSQATTEEMTGKSDRHVFDVAISAEQGQLYIAGYRQASSNYQAPFLYGYNNDLSAETPPLRLYDYWQSLVDAAQPYALGADSRIYRVVVGRDGGLYILGKADGGTTAFKTDGVIPASGNGADLSYIQPVEIDNWNKTHNLKGGWKAFFGKVDPVAGQVERGQFIVPRWPGSNDDPSSAGNGSSSRSYEVAEGSLAVDETGTIYVGASAGKYIKGRFENTLTINGQPLGEIIADDATMPDGTDIPNREMALYIVDSTLENRSTWNLLTKQQANGTVTGFDSAYGITAFVGTSSYGELFTTSNAEQPAPHNGADVALDDAYFGLVTTTSGQPDPTATPIATPPAGDLVYLYLPIVER
jgi:hypothetical protein